MRVLKSQQHFCVSQGQLSVAPQHLCHGLLHHHVAVHGPPLCAAGVQRGRAGLSTHSSNLSTKSPLACLRTSRAGGNASNLKGLIPIQRGLCGANVMINCLNVNPPMLDDCPFCGDCAYLP